MRVKTYDDETKTIMSEDEIRLILETVDLFKSWSVKMVGHKPIKIKSDGKIDYLVADADSLNIMANRLRDVLNGVIIGD